MTKEEIQVQKPTDFSTNAWLREIALLLCRLIELRERGPGRPKKK